MSEASSRFHGRNHQSDDRSTGLNANLRLGNLYGNKTTLSQPVVDVVRAMLVAPGRVQHPFTCGGLTTDDELYRQPFDRERDPPARRER